MVLLLDEKTEDKTEYELDLVSLLNSSDKKILLINGPNMNMLGKRDNNIYGSKSLGEIVEQVRNRAKNFNYALDHVVSNYEGEIIEAIHKACDKYEGIIINAAAYTHYSYAIADALDIFSKPKIEVHMSDIYEREDFRARSVIRASVDGQISGLGEQSYIRAVEQLVEIIEGRRKASSWGRTDEEYH